MKLTSLFIWKAVAELGYPVLESYLSVRGLASENLICVDPTSGPDTLALVDALVDKFPDTRRIDFEWPVTKDGSAIGIASNYALMHVRGDYVLNVQADEIWSPPLLEWAKVNLQPLTMKGLECVRFKVLNTQWNMQRFQGGEEWNGDKNTDEWRRGGLMSPDGKKGGAGYNCSVKVARRCPKIRFAHDAWTFENCAMLYHCQVSDEFPILHLHDFARDHYIALRRNAADKIWNDPGGKYGFYQGSADQVEATKDEWYNASYWTAATSPFESLLPDFAKGLLGMTSYHVRYELLDRDWD